MLALGGPVDWRQKVKAPRSLPDGQDVEAWYLAEHFVITWADWRGLWDRYSRAAGTCPYAVRRGWTRLDDVCREIASKVASDGQFDHEVASIRQHVMAMKILQEEWGTRVEVDADSLSNAMVSAHRFYTAFAKKSHTATGVEWQELNDEAESWNDRSWALWTYARPEVQRRAHTFLGHYARANVLVPWLARSIEDRLFPETSLTKAVASRKAGSMTIQEFVDQWSQESPVRTMLEGVLPRLTEAISALGYEQFVEAVASSDFVGGLDSVVGADVASINVIPGVGDDACRPVVLAVSRGAKGGVGFDAILRRLRSHLIRCRTTSAVIVICDHWSPAVLDEHIEDLRAHAANGIRFLFLLVGTPPSTIAPIAVDLAFPDILERPTEPAEPPPPPSGSKGRQTFNRGLRR